MPIEQAFVLSLALAGGLSLIIFVAGAVEIAARWRQRMAEKRIHRRVFMRDLR